jgi:hypothetical protein
VVKEPQPKADQPLAEVSKPISLETLKNKIKESVPSKDRAASAEDMHKLKDLIAAKATPPPTPTPIPTPVPQKPQEVPEDVLRKILE